jgi:hypothetical protein
VQIIYKGMWNTPVPRVGKKLKLYGQWDC